MVHFCQASVIDLLNKKKTLDGSVEVSCVHSQNGIFMLSRTFSVFGIPNVTCLETIYQGKMGLSSPTKQFLSLSVISCYSSQPFQ